jgi:hypothetical protein
MRKIFGIFTVHGGPQKIVGKFCLVTTLLEFLLSGLFLTTLYITFFILPFFQYSKFYKIKSLKLLESNFPLKFNKAQNTLLQINTLYECTRYNFHLHSPYLVGEHSDETRLFVTDLWSGQKIIDLSFDVKFAFRGMVSVDFYCAKIGPEFSCSPVNC